MSHYFYNTPEEYATAEEIGITPAMLDRRVREQGWPKERAMTTPPRKITDRSRWRYVAEQNGIKYAAFMSRINLGWSEEKAATKPIESEQERREHALRATECLRTYPKVMVDLADRNGISYHAFVNRVKNLKWDFERAATEPVWKPADSGRLGAQRLRDREGDWAAQIFGS
ncbi:hypothetical protein J2T13_003637 [Paenibacillus sp. DS2015]|uniref:hypothetical protein n=1 Tax=Paenibacillus sp. DS2015 TaxID=3373917 RepID=UPI003D21EC1D